MSKYALYGSGGGGGSSRSTGSARGGLFSRVRAGAAAIARRLRRRR